VSDTKEKLTKAAIRLLDTCREDKISLRAVARAASVSEATPYRHFKNKTELMATVASHGFVLLAAEMANLKTRCDLKRADLWACYSAFARSNPAMYDLMHRIDPGPAGGGSDLKQQALAAFDVLQSLVQKLEPEAGMRETAELWFEFHGRVEIEKVGLVPPSVLATLYPAGSD